MSEKEQRRWYQEGYIIAPEEWVVLNVLRDFSTYFVDWQSLKNPDAEPILWNSDPHYLPTMAEMEPYVDFLRVLDLGNDFEQRRQRLRVDVEARDNQPLQPLSLATGETALFAEAHFSSMFDLTWPDHMDMSYIEAGWDKRARDLLTKGRLATLVDNYLELRHPDEGTKQSLYQTIIETDAHIDLSRSWIQSADLHEVLMSWLSHHQDLSLQAGDEVKSFLRGQLLARYLTMSCEGISDQVLIPLEDISRLSVIPSVSYEEIRDQVTNKTITRRMRQDLVMAATGESRLSSLRARLDTGELHADTLFVKNMAATFRYVGAMKYGHHRERTADHQESRLLHKARESWIDRYCYLRTAGHVSTQELAQLFVFETQALGLESWMRSFNSTTSQTFFNGIWAEISTALHYIDDGGKVAIPQETEDDAQVDLWVEDSAGVRKAIQIKGKYGRNVVEEIPLNRGDRASVEKLCLTAKRYGAEPIWVEAPSRAESYLSTYGLTSLGSTLNVVDRYYGL